MTLNNLNIEQNSYNWNKEPIFDLNGVRDSTYSHIDLFSGCGGFSVGFEQAGFNTDVSVDIHPQSIDTIKKNHKNTSTILGDIRKVDPKDVKNILNPNSKFSVVTAGVPNFGDSMNIIFGKHQYVPNLGTNSKAEWHFETNSSRAVVLQLWDESAALSTSYHQNITPSAEAVKDITATSWTHFVFTYNGSSDASGMEIYVNGVKDEGASIQSHSNFVAMETLNIPISVGGALNDSPGQTSQTSPNRDFYGNIAEIAIWRHEDEREILNADTIKLLYQAGSDSTKFENTTPATRAMNNVLTSSFFDISDIGSRFTSCNTGFIFGKNIVSASNMSGINNHLGVDSIAFGGLLK